MTLTFPEYVTNLFDTMVYVTKGVANGTDKLIYNGKLDVGSVEKLTYVSKTTGATVTCVEGTDFTLSGIDSITWKGANQPPQGTMYQAKVWYSPKYDYVGAEQIIPFDNLFVIRYRYASARVMGNGASGANNARLVHNKVEISSVTGVSHPTIRNILEYSIVNKNFASNNVVATGKFEQQLAVGETKPVYDNFTWHDMPASNTDLQGALTLKWTNSDVSEPNKTVVQPRVAVNQIPNLPTVTNTPANGEIALFTGTDLGTVTINQTVAQGVDINRYSAIPTIKSVLSNNRIQYHIPSLPPTNKLTFASGDKDIVYIGALIANEWNSQYNWSSSGSVITDINFLYENMMIEGSVRTNTTSIGRELPPPAVGTATSFNVGESLVVTNPTFGAYQRARTALDYEFLFSAQNVMPTAISYKNVAFNASNVATFTFTDPQVQTMYTNMTSMTSFNNGLLFTITTIKNSAGQQTTYSREILYGGQYVTGRIVDAQPTMVASDFKLQNLDATVVSLGLPDWTTLQGYFKAKLVSGIASPKKGATIKNYNVTLYNQTDGAPTVTASQVSSKNFDLTSTNVTRADATITATDSRTNKVTVSNSVTVIPYSKPVIVAKAERLNKIETETVLSITGTFNPIPVTVGGTTTDKNTILGLWYRTREEGGAWSNLTKIPCTTNGGNLVVQDVSIQLDASKKFNIEVIITDKLNNTTTSSLTVDRATPVMFIDANKNALGINRLPFLGNSLEVDYRILTKRFDLVDNFEFKRSDNDYIGLEMNTASSIGGTYIDWHTGINGVNNNNDYDVRMYANGGDPNSSGAGRMTISANNTVFAPSNGSNSRIAGNQWLADGNSVNMYVITGTNGSVAIKQNSYDGAFRPIQASAFNVNSDVNSKTNLTLIQDSPIAPNALKVIEETDVFVYNLKDEWSEGEKITTSNSRVGFISQLVPDILEADKGVDLYGSVGFVYQGVKELLAMVRKTNKQVARLQQEVDNLKKAQSESDKVIKDLVARLTKLENK